MRIDDLRAFMLVAQHGSLHRATEHMGVTQSALSKALARLEAETGMRLFERSSRGVTLTLVGESLLARARQVVLATQDFEQEIEAQRAARSGKIRLAATPYLVATVLTPVIARFLAHRPLASFAVETRLTHGAIQALQSGEADFACGGLTDDVPEDICRALLQPLRLRIVAREDHPRRMAFRTLADLANERWALPQTSSSLYQVLAHQSAELGLPPPRVAVEWTGSGVPIAELLRNTDLLGLLPHHTLTGPDGRGLCVIADGERLREPKVALLWRDDGYLSPLCVEFREALVAFSRESETAATQRRED